MSEENQDKMKNFKPDDEGDVVSYEEIAEESSGEEGESGEEEESDDKEDSNDKEDSDEESDDDGGEPAKKKPKVANPFFSQPSTSKSNDQDTVESSDVSDDSDLDDSDDDSDDDGDDEPTKDETEPADDDEDPLIVALRKAKEKKVRTAPPDIRSPGMLTDISFHPEKDIIAAASIDGLITLHEYGLEENKLTKKLQIHKSTVRSIEFDDDGSCLYSGSKDKSFKITDVESFQVKYKVPKAHDSPLYCVKPINEHLCASGDEDGMVKLWDYRCPKSVMEHKQFDEFVSCMYVSEDKKILVGASGEGTIQGFNIRGKKPDTMSEVYDGEMNTLGTLRNGSVMVAGCGNGKLYMFKWGEWGFHADQFPGHPDAINCLVPVTENVVITACEDGALRAVHLYPHRFLGAVGHHDQEFPVERLDISSGGDIVASISHDQKIKFWSVKYLEEMEYNKTKKPFRHRGKLRIRRKEQKMLFAREMEHQLPSSNRSNRKDFFSGLAE